MNIAIIKEKLPHITAVLLVVFILNLMKNEKDWTIENKTISWDVISYYAYLPAVFIYHDCTLKFVETYKGPHKFVFWADPGPNNSKVIRTSMGLSIIYSPFFFIAHWYASTHGYDAGGYSVPYRVALLMSCVFIVLIGLFFFARLLLNFFNPYISSWLMILIVLGTNLLYYCVYEAPVTHAYNFSLIIIFVYYTIKWYENPRVKTTIIIGLLAGLITLIRPVNCIVCLFFLLWDIKNFTDIKNRILLLSQKWWMLAIIAGMIFLVWLPQIVYWKIVTGQYLYYSYGDQGFFFLHPKIIKGLFSYRKGWLLYTPLMVLALAGIPLLWKKQKAFFYPVVIILAIHIYVVFSWWTWWYGGSMGSRPMIDLYGLLAIPMGYLFVSSLELKKVLRLILIGLSVILLAIGLFHTDKYRHGSLHYDSMTKAAFWDSYFRRTPSHKFWSLLEQPDYDLAKKGIDATIQKK